MSVMELDAKIRERIRTLGGWTECSSAEFEFYTGGNNWTMEIDVDADFQGDAAMEVFNLRFALRDSAVRQAHRDTPPAPTLTEARALVFAIARLFADQPVDDAVIRNFVSTARIADRRKDELGFVEISIAVRVDYDADRIVWEES